MINCKVFLKTLKDYIAGELAGDSKRLSEEHINTCSSCKNIYDEQLEIYKLLQSAAANIPTEFSSSRNEILNRIDKTRYNKRLPNKASFFFKRNSLRGAVSGIALILFMYSIPYIYSNLKVSSHIETSSENNVKQNNLDIIKDIEYVSLLQEGVVEGAFLDKVIFSDKDKTLTDKIKDCILSGSVIEDISMSSESTNPLIIGIKQKDGSYIEGEYKAGNVIFYKPVKVVVKTNGNLDPLIEDFKSRKLNAAAQDIKHLGQVRNNNIIIERTKISSYSNDPVFENFKGSDKKPVEYEQALIEEAVTLGIDEKKLSNALKKAKQYKNNIKTQYPVIIDTGTYRDKKCFILTFTWESMLPNASQNSVQNLGHVFTVILDEDGNEVAYLTCR
jgi:hypothetical protein